MLRVSPVHQYLCWQSCPLLSACLREQEHLWRSRMCLLMQGFPREHESQRSHCYWVRNSVATCSFPGNRSVITASWIRRRRKCWARLIMSKAKEHRRSRRTSRITGKKSPWAIGLSKRTVRDCEVGGGGYCITALCLFLWLLGFWSGKYETHEQSKQSSVRTSDLKSELPLTLTSEGPREEMSPLLAAAGSHQHRETASSKESETNSHNQTLQGIQISSWRQGTRYCVTEYSCLHKPIFISKTSPGRVLLCGPIKLKTKLCTRTTTKRKKIRCLISYFFQNINNTQ